MKIVIAAALLLVLSGAPHAEEISQAIPSSVIHDPAPDPLHPPSSAQVLIPSHGMGMNALFYLAGGAGPHPTMVLLHGFPGNEQNLDLAQAIRRTGWNVLTLHYRGAWGSPGVLHRFRRWRCAGWRTLPSTKLYGELRLVNLVGLIPSIAARRGASS